MPLSECIKHADEEECRYINIFLHPIPVES